jgi:hypothetical protein
MGSNVNHFEQAVQALLSLHFNEVLPQAKTDWVGLYGQKIRVDFLCVRASGESVAFEVKFQESSGSADQKLVYAVAQIKRCHKTPTYLLLAGNGWGKGSLNWAKNQPLTSEFLGVLTMDDFLEIVKHG